RFLRFTYSDVLMSPMAIVNYTLSLHDALPILNMDNPEVRAEICRIMGYWIQLGISGFRVDAVPFLLESKKPGKKKADTKFEYLRSEEHTSELQSRENLVCRLLLEKKKLQLNNT